MFERDAENHPSPHPTEWRMQESRGKAISRPSKTVHADQAENAGKWSGPYPIERRMRGSSYQPAEQRMQEGATSRPSGECRKAVRPPAQLSEECRKRPRPHPTEWRIQESRGKAISRPSETAHADQAENAGKWSGPIDILVALVTSPLIFGYKNARTNRTWIVVNILITKANQRIKLCTKS